MKTEPRNLVTIPIETDAEAKRVLEDDFDKLSRELQKAEPKVKIEHRGVSGGSKDAAIIITAAAGVIVAATPIITQVISGFFAARGIKVELKAEAKTGKITYKASKQ